MMAYDLLAVARLLDIETESCSMNSKRRTARCCTVYQTFAGLGQICSQ